MAALEAGIARLFAAPDAAGEDGAVEIMTMHKSKGLQFETVILYGLHRAPRGDQAPLVRFEQNADRCCSARSSRAPRPRPIPCPATWARARRAARPMRWTGCCTWPPRARASACIWSAMCRWTTPTGQGPASGQPAWPPVALADAAAAAAREGEARLPTTARNGRAIPCVASPPPDWRSWPAAPSPVSARASAGARDGWGDAAEHPAWQLRPAMTPPSARWRTPGSERIGRDASPPGRPRRWPAACPPCGAS